MNIKSVMIVLALALAVPPNAAFAENTRQKGGIFGFLKGNPEKAAARAERKAERQAKRKSGGKQSNASAARAEVKAAVAYANANRPRGRLWCVPFARTVSGVDIRGNAKTWWRQAKGKYARGNDPQIGAVISFAASRSMPLGHVGVVSDVLGAREILVDHANWDRNRVTQDARVVDVSPHNDWSKVRVENSAGTLGRINPVNGFIYN